jgi:ABC-2 type transport system permease protein
MAQSPLRSRASGAVARHALRQERVRLGVIAAIVALYAVANVIGYRDSYPTPAGRVRFAAVFKDDLALRLFYGIPHDLATVGGYAEFRCVGLLSVLVAGWAVFAAVRALRGEEDAGRFELILAGSLTRRAATGAIMLALAIDCIAIWAAASLALLVTATTGGDTSAGGALLLALAVVAPAVLFGAIAVLACQMASTHRGAQGLGSALLAAALLLRMIADLASGAGWLRWATPFGWAEELRPITGPAPAVFALFALATLLVAGAALAIANRRDVATSLLTRHHQPRSRSTLLDSPSQAALRSEMPTLLTWLGAAGIFALILGAFAKSLAEEGKKSGLHTFGTADTTATSYLSYSFVLFALIVALFAASHINSIRDEESSGRLETLFALSVSRRDWISGRLAIATASTAALAVLLGLLAWVGAASQHAGVGLAALAEAGLNCIPAALLFLALGILLFALAPRQSTGASLTLVGAAFLWQLVGALVSAPSWLLAVSPFNHLAAVPLQAFDARGAIIMLLIATLAATAGVRTFMGRDLQTG